MKNIIFALFLVFVLAGNASAIMGVPMYGAAADTSDVSLTGTTTTQTLTVSDGYTTTLDGPVVIGESLGPELLTQTCAGWGLTNPVGAWSCTGGTITRTASGSDLTITNTAAVAGTTYKVVVTYATITAGTFKATIGANSGVLRSTAATYTEYIKAGTTGAMTITAVAASAGTITISTTSVKADTSTITSGTGPLVFGSSITGLSLAQDATYSHIISPSSAEGLAGNDLRIGLDESNRTLIISDRGDINTDFGASAQSDPTIVLFQSTPSLGGITYWNQAGLSFGNPAATVTTGTIAASRSVNAPQAVTCTDNAGGTNQAVTITPTSDYVEVTQSDATGCDITMGESGIAAGRVVTICNVSVTGATKVNFADTAGVSELAGAFASDVDDCITLRYGNTTTWREVSRSAN